MNSFLLEIFCPQAGGSVSSNGRLQGRLEVSRAFGDRQFKKVLISFLLDALPCTFMVSVLNLALKKLYIAVYEKDQICNE